MAESFGSSAAESYKQASFSAQKRIGEDFIQRDVCPQVGDVILDLGCGTGELSAYPVSYTHLTLPTNREV